MTPRIFVCHAKSDIEATSEIVDLLESALLLPADSLSSSSLPGYSSDARSEPELRDMLSGATVVLALVTERSATDNSFAFELGAAWALGVRVVPLLTGAASISDLPWALRGAPAVRPHDRLAWVMFVEQLAQLLGVRARLAEAGLVLDDITARASIAAAHGVRETTSGFSTSVRETTSENFAISSVAPFSSTPSTPPGQTVDAGEPVLSRQLALEAGRAMSDCVWHRNEALDFARELTPQFGRFIDALGGSWEDLRKLAQFDVWLGMTDNLLEGLPEAQRELSSWYHLGYELATLHNLAGEAEPGTSEERADQEKRGHDALERFLSHAEAVRIRYEDLGQVLTQIENLTGPASARDFTNIARSLEALREHAEFADRMTSAA